MGGEALLVVTDGGEAQPSEPEPLQPRRGSDTPKGDLQPRMKRETSIDRMRSVHAGPNLAKSLIVLARRAFRPLQQARLCCKDSFHSTDLLAVSERAAEANLHASGRKPRLRRSLDDRVSCKAY